MSLPRIGIAKLAATVFGCGAIGLAIGLTIAVRTAETDSNAAGGPDTAPQVVSRPDSEPEAASGMSRPEPHRAQRATAAPPDGDGQDDHADAIRESNHLTAAVGRGDDLLREGNAHAALERYCDAISLCDGRSRDQLIGRMAICQEVLGDLETALANYRLLAGRTIDDQLRRCALLGQARIRLETGQLDVARPILCGLLLDHADHPTREQADLHADACHLWGLLLSRDCIVEAALPLTRAEAIIAPIPALDAADALGRITGPPNPFETAPDKVGVKIEFRGSSPDDIVLSVHLRQQPVSEILASVAEQTGTKFPLSPGAAEVLRGRTSRVAVSGTTVARLLDLLLTPHDLVWLMPEDVVTIQTAEELSAEERRSAQLALAARNLHFATSAWPDHPLAASTSLVSGNIEYGRGNLEGAARIWQRMLSQYPRSPLRAAACFNLAKAYLRTGNSAAAREALYAAVDTGTGQPCEAAAYVHLGRLLLDESELRDACRAERRAIAIAASDIDSAATGTLLLATAWLIRGEPAEAERILTEHRTKLRPAEFQPRAMFLRMLARYRLAAGTPDVDSAGRALVVALSQVRPEEFLTLSEYLLMAEAYDDAGFPNEAIRTYELALENVGPAPARDRLALALARCHFRERNVAKARELLVPIAKRAESPIAAEAARLLAEVALATGEDDDCLRYCQAVLSVVDAGTKPAVLNLMGRVYERRGDFQNAAICFSGMVPPESGAEDSNKDTR